MRRFSPLVFASMLLLGSIVIGDPKTPVVIDKPIMFNTPEADKIVSQLQIFPPDNPWNEDISKLPVHPNSKKIIATIGPEKRFAYNSDMAYILVPPTQKKIDLKIVSYPDESDPGPFPLPDNAPIEGWPLDKRTLDAAQRGKEDADRHVVVVDPVSKKLYEFYQGRKTDNGWTCACTAIFDLTSNKLRPDTWTSTDAAGLPIFPSIVRFDEVEKGMVNHAMRFTVRRSQRAYVYPATHFASSLKDPDLPRMGERFRLRADYDISGFSPHVQAILKGLKKYGMFVADNGGDWRMSVAPDERIKGLDELRKIKGSDFEVVKTTGSNEGPRAKK
ncbi:hypothetical protein [Zavarzinella formosa]|uniref:hypothetical protein n=1 Tax=Zavarzinella formosa TaxID=360055 RepID=UPI0003194F0A|nr:hypothetical protein [Zavarzinella formosa]